MKSPAPASASSRFFARCSVSLLALFVGASSVACGTEGRSSDSSFAGSEQSGNQNGQTANGNGGSNSNATAQRAIEEADVIQLDETQQRLFAMSKSGTLTVIDVSKPGSLAILGQAYLPGQPFEMYLRGDLLVAMTNGAYAVSGTVNEPARPTASGAPSAGQGASSSTSPASPAIDPASGAGVIVINVKDAGLMQRVATFPVAGEIADSRIVGDILYLATYENSACYRCGAQNRTLVTSFDIASPQSMRQVDQAIFQTNDIAWGVNWKRSIVATSERMYVGGHAAQLDFSGKQKEGIIDVLDISDPSGKIGKGTQIETAGAVLSRWQMDERDGVLRVISQPGVGFTANGTGMPSVEMFNIWNTRSLQLMGETKLTLPRQEGLKSVRFDKDRAYAITFEQRDPLIVIDLKSASAPKQRGQLSMPGYVFHLEPSGDRLLGLGVDATDPQGNLNVSLFDVADMDHPSMIKRVSFGSIRSGQTNAGIASYELPEDQDRIQKAFRVLDGGLVVVPFSGATTGYNGAGSNVATGAVCQNNGGVQLIDWQQDNLEKRSLLPMSGNPRRAILRQNRAELIAVSDSNVTSFDITQRSSAIKQADVIIGSCETSRSARPRSSRPTSSSARARFATTRRPAAGRGGISATIRSRATTTTGCSPVRRRRFHPVTFAASGRLRSWAPRSRSVVSPAAGAHVHDGCASPGM